MAEEEMGPRRGCGLGEGEGGVEEMMRFGEKMFLKIR
jgi:hypothetical protein